MKHYILFFATVLLIFDYAFGVDFPKPQKAPNLSASVGFPQTTSDLSKDSKLDLYTDGYKPYVDKSAYQELNLVKDPNAEKGDIQASANWNELDCREYYWNNVKYGKQLGEKNKLLGSMSSWFRDANIEEDDYKYHWTCPGGSEHTDDYCYCENTEEDGMIEEDQGDKVVSKYVEKITDDMFVYSRRGSFRFLIRDWKNIQFNIYGAASCINDKNAKPKYRQTNGQYCFCKTYASFECKDLKGCSALGDTDAKPTHADWVYMGDKGTTQNCIQSCTKDCVRASILKKPGFYYYPEGYKQELGEVRTGTVTVSGVTWYSSEHPYGVEGSAEDKQRAQDAADEVYNQN